MVADPSTYPWAAATARVRDDGLGVVPPCPPKPSYRLDPLEPDVGLDEVLYWPGKGGLRETQKEVLEFGVNDPEIWEEAYSEMMATSDAAVGNASIGCLTIPEAINLLDTSTSAGTPYKHQYRSKLELIDALGFNGLCELVADTEDAICRGESVEMAFAVFSKKDKYKKKKIDTSRFRTIQGGDVVLLIIMMRWFHRLADTLYEQHPRFYQKKTRQDFGRIISRGFSNKKTVGIDFRGFDRNVNWRFTSRLLQDLGDRVGMPPALSAHIADVLAFGLLEMPDGEYWMRYGGNPSGQYLTSLLNCLFNDYLKLYSYAVLFQCSCQDVVNFVLYVVCGDDSVDGFTPGSEPPLDKLMEAFAVHGMELELDLLEGDYYPASLGSHAPFLSTVTFCHGGYTVPLPVEPRRILGWTMTTVPHRTLEEQFASWSGVYNEALSYMVAKIVDPTYRVPQPICRFFERFEGLQARAMEAGLPPTAMSVEQAFVVLCGSTLEAGHDAPERLA